MKISIDEDVVKKLTTLDGKKLSIGEVLVCLLIKLDYNINEVIDELVSKGVLLKDPKIPDHLLIFMKYSKLTERIILQSDKSIPKAEELTELAKQLQELWPKGSKRDDNGKPKWSWRGNALDNASRLQKVFKLYGNVGTNEQILQAGKNYVEKHKYDLRSMRTLQYFIIKSTEDGLKSDLVTELELLNSGEDEALNMDWNVNLSTDE